MFFQKLLTVVCSNICRSLIVTNTNFLAEKNYFIQAHLENLITQCNLKEEVFNIV